PVRLLRVLVGDALLRAPRGRRCLRLDHRVGNHRGNDVIITGTTALLLHLAATFGSMAFGTIIALWKEKREWQGVEPALFESQSPLPGNGFLKAETKSSKGLRRFKNAVAETEFR